MASNVVTVNPRKKPTGTQIPAASRNVNSDTLETGTVLLRNPLPKYTFEKKTSKVKKQTKEKAADEKFKKDLNNSDNTQSNGSNTRKDKSPSANMNTSDSTVSIAQTSESNRIGKLVNSFPQAMVTPELLQEEAQSTGRVIKSDNTEPVKSDKPINKVDPFSASDKKKLNHSVSEPVIEHQNQQTGTPSIRAESDTVLQEGETSPQQASSSMRQSADSASQVAGYQDRIRHLEEEKQLLKNQLEVQLQVNQELKKLLVASVGEDLHHRVERLMTERAQMSLELGDFSKKVTEDYEHLDKISIQADMWRSKYLACRVMSDELAASKAFYSMQFQECQMAIQQMLNERHELKVNLYECYRGLQQIQEAFDPFNTQNALPRTLSSKNTIDLARTNQILVDRIKYRLLPSHVTSSLSTKMEPDWHDYLTQAEAHAQELLSREMRPEDFRCLQHSAIMAPGCLAVDRYHPFANYDNLTLNVCCHCKGEIRVV